MTRPRCAHWIWRQRRLLILVVLTLVFAWQGARGIFSPRFGLCSQACTCCRATPLDGSLGLGNGRDGHSHAGDSNG
jgi:hypothetical protein